MRWMRALLSDDGKPLLRKVASGGGALSRRGLRMGALRHRPRPLSRLRWISRELRVRDGQGAPLRHVPVGEAVSALLKLRDYQTETIRALHQRWDAGAGRVPSVLATGL